MGFRYLRNNGGDVTEKAWYHNKKSGIIVGIVIGTAKVYSDCQPRYGILVFGSDYSKIPLNRYQCSY